MRVMKLSPFRTPARNGALLYMACGNVSVRSARLLPGLLTCHRSRQLASLRSVQGARPLRRSAAIPRDTATLLSPCWSCEAWSRTDRCVQLDTKWPVRGLGEPQQAASEYRKRYSDALLARSKTYNLTRPSACAILCPATTRKSQFVQSLGELKYNKSRLLEKFTRTFEGLTPGTAEPGHNF